MIKSVRQADVQLYDNYNGTWWIEPLTIKAGDLFQVQFKVRSFIIHDSELIKIVLLCASNGLLISPILNVGVTTMTDRNGKPLIDPKIPANPLIDPKIPANPLIDPKIHANG